MESSSFAGRPADGQSEMDASPPQGGVATVTDENRQDERGFTSVPIFVVAPRRARPDRTKERPSAYQRANFATYSDWSERTLQ